MRVMTSAHFSAIPTLEEAARFTAQQVVELATANAQLHHQLEWFKRQIFGSKSEKRLVANPAQLTLGEMPIPESMPQAPGKPIAAHTRRPPAILPRMPKTTACSSTTSVCRWRQLPCRIGKSKACRRTSMKSSARR
jgi:hypothetical protein